MIWCETGGEESQDLEELAVFVSQLDALGYPARVDHRSVPQGLRRNAQFDLAPFLADGAPGPEDQIVVVAAHRIADAKLAGFRRLARSQALPAVAFGLFGSRQAQISAKAKLSYVLGQDPEVVDLAGDGHSSEEAGQNCPVIGVPRMRGSAGRPRLVLLEPDLQDARQASALIALSLSRKFEIAVVTDGKSKQAWISGNGAAIPFYHYGEALPLALAERFDVLASFRSLQKNYRLQTLAANLTVSGAALLDGSEGHSIAKGNDAFIRGPVDLSDLGSFVTSEILPNLAVIGAHVRGSAAAMRLSGARLAALSPAVPTERSRRSAGGASDAARILFAPTNGVGLGHAQRCSLVAAELDREKFDPVFAVFPSCMRLVRSWGFDAMPLIARSALHAQSHENDLPNYLRLRALAETAGTLVFDGGYIFDSVYRTILDRAMTGVWIRRGLWRPDQDNTVSLDREKAFARVIVPTEAFEELNVAYSHGGHLRRVGPIVQQVAQNPKQRAALRAGLAAHYGLDFTRLVVTKLGAGVASDRRAQTQAICGLMERRGDVLHLVVVWPTATLDPGVAGWSRSRAVATLHAGVLAAAADLCISAAGYNSYHELLYSGVPTIFMPQDAPFMDDQRARARAAKDRALAALVEPHELMALEREIARHLDGGEATEVRRRLAALDLPPPGNAAAAAMIEEVAGGGAAMGRSHVPDHAGWG